jgi:tripartite-type tricarboxylate transporter receptor subunit TctC
MRLLIAFLVAVSVATAFAQSYPSKPIRVVVPATPGGAIDLAARTIGAKLTDAWGQPVVVENRGGAAGIVGSDTVAKAAPDGYTLALVASSHAINASLYPKLPFDTVKDFAPVILTHVVPLVLVVNQSLPAKSVKEFISYAKANPGKLSFASSGNGGAPHLSAELFKAMAGIDMLHVPYKGSTAAHPDLLSGQVLVMFDTVVAIAPHVKSGKVRALGVTTTRRSAVLPDVPPISQAGLPGYDTSTWGGVLAPGGTPMEIVAKLNGEIARILKMPDVRERMMNAGSEPGGGTPGQFKAFIDAEMIKWAKVVKDSGAKADQ